MRKYRRDGVLGCLLGGRLLRVNVCYFYYLVISPYLRYGSMPM